MNGTVRHLRAHDVWSALEVIDPVTALAEDLIGRQVGRTGHSHVVTGHLRPWRGSEWPGADLVWLDPPGHTVPCVLPADCVRTANAATLAAIAARELLVSGGTTLAMLGPAEVTQPQLSVIARHVPDISHVALWMGSVPGQLVVEPKLADQLELGGIGVSVAGNPTDSMFGANFVVAAGGGAGPDLAGLRPDLLAQGTVLVNATGADLPETLVDQVDLVYVDDQGLLEAHSDRNVVARYLGDGDARRSRRGHPDVVGDLAELLTGRVRGRRRPDDVVLVELLGAHELNASLAHRICDGALRTGLGARLPT
jgi:ornithine cyclodeaminase/alanine dehydrogenase-like protein (mu-crystallin family)